MNFHKFYLVFVPLLAPLLLRAGAPTLVNSPLTVLMDFESPHSEVSLTALRGSLSLLLQPSGLVVDVQLKSDLTPNAQFGQLVVFKMKGSCSLSSAPLPIGALSDERGPLAMAYISDGQVLHFGEVQCDRVRHSVQRVLGWSATFQSQKTYGSALAVVIAHEVYHMLGNERKHTRQGVTKSSLSAFELIDPRLALPSPADSAIGASFHE